MKRLGDSVHGALKLLAPRIGRSAELRGYLRPLHAFCPAHRHFADLSIHQSERSIHQISTQHLLARLSGSGRWFRAIVAELHIPPYVAPLSIFVSGPHG